MPNPTGKGGFQKGHDPKRHVLTTEERRKGYRTAVAGRGVRFQTFLRGKVATTARPETVQKYKEQFTRKRSIDP